MGSTVFDPPLLPDRAATQISTAVATAVVGANVAVQAAGAVGAFQGLVRMTPETLELLKMYDLMTKRRGVRGHDRRCQRPLRGPRPVGAGRSSRCSRGLAPAGPAVALLTIQVQLAAITSLVQDNLALTDKLLRDVRTERWAEVAGLHQAMLKAVEEARHVGAVIDPIWENVAAHEAELSKVRNEFREKVAAHLSSLQGRDGHRERREYILHHGDAILRDAQALMQAQAAWFTYQAIRAGHLYQQSKSDDTAEKLLKKVVADARTVHDQDLEATAELLRALHRQFSLMAELPGKPTLPFGKGRREAKDVARASRTLLDQLKLLRDGIGLSDPPIPTAAITAFEDDVPGLLPRVLRWHLRPDEELLALGAAKGRGWPVHRDESFIAVTDQRLLVADSTALGSRGEVGIAVPLSDIRYVRFRPAANEGQKAGRLDIFTPELDLRLTFDEWAARRVTRPTSHGSHSCSAATCPFRHRRCLPRRWPAESPPCSSTCRTIRPRRPAAEILSGSQFLPEDASATRWPGSVATEVDLPQRCHQAATETRDARQACWSITHRLASCADRRGRVGSHPQGQPRSATSGHRHPARRCRCRPGPRAGRPSPGRAWRPR